MGFIRGTDISYCQNGINYDYLKAESKFVLIRAGHGLKVDDLYSVHTRECYTRGIPIGYYWFCESNTVAGVRAEAAKCIATLGIWKDYQQYPIFFDLEDNAIVNGLTKAQITNLATAFCDAMTAAGYYAGIYTNPDWLQNKYDQTKLVGKYDIWLAHWTYNANTDSKYDFKQTIHQWGTIDVGGMSVDADKCYVDYPNIIKKWRESRSTTTKTTFNKGNSLLLFGIPVYANSADTSPIKHLAADTTLYEIETGMIENNRILVHSKTNVNDKFYVDINCVKSADNKTATVGHSDAQITKIATDCIRGLYGSGTMRKKLLEKYGYDYNAVQAKINELLKK